MSSRGPLFTAVYPSNLKLVWWVITYLVQACVSLLIIGAGDGATMLGPIEGPRADSHIVQQAIKHLIAVLDVSDNDGSQSKGLL